MDSGHLSLAEDVTETRKQRARRRKNDAFRRRVEERKAARETARRMRMATCGALLAWIFVGVQLLLHR